MMRIPKQRRVAALNAAGHGVLVMENMPKPSRGQLLVQVRASMISPGTELTGVRNARLSGGDKAGALGRSPPARAQPRVFGYQNAGIVVAAAGGVRGFQVGDRVACMGAGYALHTDYAVVPQNLCCRLPNSVSFEEAACMNLCLTSLQAVRRARLEVGQNVLVAGLGLVGQLIAQMARLSGAWVSASDLLTFRMRLARRLGAQGTMRSNAPELESWSSRMTEGRGLDAAFLATAGDATHLVQKIVKLMQLSPDGHPMGKIILVGGTTCCHWGAPMGNLDVLSSARSGPGYHDPAWEHGRCTYPPVFIRWTTQDHLRLIVRWIESKKLNIKALITHRFGLEQIDTAVTTCIESPASTLGVVLSADAPSGRTERPRS